MSRLKLKSVCFLGATGCDLLFDDDGMFWGHSVVVSTFDAAETWSHVELFG